MNYEQYIKEIARLICEIDDDVVLMKIYTFVKTHHRILREKEVQENG